jgi:hypothetical protein
MGLLDLFKPAWQHSDWKKRRKAVEKITDQSILKEVVLKDKESFVRRAAVWKITDQAFLREVALKDKNEVVRYAAVSRIKHL